MTRQDAMQLLMEEVCGWLGGVEWWMDAEGRKREREWVGDLRFK